MQTITRPGHRLFTYGSLALGVTGMASHHADAATVVDVNAATFDSTFSTFGTIGFAHPIDNTEEKGDVTFSGTGVALSADSTGTVILRGISADPLTDGTAVVNSLRYAAAGAAKNNAVLNSNDNWVYAKGPGESDQGAWIQFSFGDGLSGGIIDTVIFTDVAGELPTAAEAAALVPEPSALLLLSLGATGLLARRRRTAA